MSIETIAIVISALSLLLGFFGAFAWMIRRSDSQLERLGDRISGVQRDLGDRISGVQRDLGDRISGVERELVEVKVGLARIEGPPRRLLTER